MKTTSVAADSKAVSLNIYTGNSKITILENTNPIPLVGFVEEVESFAYLESITDEQVGFGAGLKARIGGAKKTFLQLKNI